MGLTRWFRALLHEELCELQSWSLTGEILPITIISTLVCRFVLSPALPEHPSALLWSVSIVTSPPCSQSALFKSELITLLFINHPWLPTILSVKSGFFFFPWPIRLSMIWPLLFSLTSSHTLLHFTHSVPATPNLMFLEYVELILAPSLFMCCALFLEGFSPRFWHGSVPSLHPDLCSDITVFKVLICSCL